MVDAVVYRNMEHRRQYMPVSPPIKPQPFYCRPETGIISKALQSVRYSSAASRPSNIASRSTMYARGLIGKRAVPLLYLPTELEQLAVLSEVCLRFGKPEILS